MASRVLIEDTLELLRCVFDVLLPLCLEEVQALARDNLRVLLLQVPHSCNALVEGCVCDLAGYRDFNWLLVSCARHF